MLKTHKFAVVALLGALAINPAFAEEKSAALVNGVSISQARVDARVKDALAQGQTDTPELRKAIRENMIRFELVIQEAKKLGLDKKPDILQQIDTATQQVLLSAFVRDYADSHPISDDVLKQEYDKLKAKLGDKEYNARHILVETEAEAKDIITQLEQLNEKRTKKSKKADKPETLDSKFGELAAKSKDTGSAENGGSLGWSAPSNFVAPFAEAMTALKKGEYTKTPVKSQFGWHVIKLDDVRDLKAPPFDEVKPQLQQRLQQQAIQKAIEDLRAKAKVE
jgi:peptidyl-prolyl cis-trans isomerase C